MPALALDPTCHCTLRPVTRACRSAHQSSRQMVPAALARRCQCKSSGSGRGSDRHGTAVAVAVAVAPALAVTSYNGNGGSSGQNDASFDAESPTGYLLRFLLQVQFYQDRPQLFAKMSKPHTFGFLLYRVPGNTLPDGVAPRPVRTFNATVPSHWADEQLPPLLALRIQALGRATAAGVLDGFDGGSLGCCVSPLNLTVSQ